MNTNSKILLALICIAAPFGGRGAFAQEKKVVVSGSVQSDMMIAPMQDESIGTKEYDNKYFLTNTYADVNLQSKWVDAGARLEFNQFPMPGFNDASNKFKGWGLPNIWVKGKFGKVDVTLGSFYEQFGSGFILRTYEERTLGVDNSLNGGHVVYTPVAGLRLKALAGVQRTYWKWEKNVVSGADVEFALNDVIKSWKQNGTHLTFGLSWVNKFENNTDPRIIFKDSLNAETGESSISAYKVMTPKTVNAVDARVKFQKNGFSALAEYAWKSEDPNEMNSYTYGNGHAEMLSLSYANTKKGISALLQAKRSENMAYRSSNAYGGANTSGYINHLPAFTVDQTYSLAALYPYATQMEGEWAYQGSIGYKFKGRYAPKFKANYSIVTGLENCTTSGNTELYATDWKKSSFFKHGDIYYQDFDFIYEQKYNKHFELHAMYMYQQYNKTKIRGAGGTIKSHIVVLDGKYKFNKRFTLRGEAQYLHTAHESGDWGFGLLELSVAPYLMFTVSDQIGRCEPKDDEYGDVTHYYQAMITGNYKSHRLQLAYGRTRSGYNCNGGVCRYIPASKGFTISYNYNF